MAAGNTTLFEKMMKKSIYLFLLFAVTFMQQALAQDLSLFQKFKFIQNGDTLPYRLLLPENYDASKKYPLLLFLHGRGESGTDNEKQLTHGAALFLKNENRKQYPAIVLFPQNPVNSYWSNVQMVMDNKGSRTFHFINSGEPSTSMRLVMSLLRHIFSNYNISNQQVYVMGLSMGGMGTFEIVNRMPNTFAAAVPICGGASPANARNLVRTNWWVFHGAKDDVVPPVHSENMVKAMRRNNVPVKFTLYPNANHNSWDPAFNEPDLLKWLFSKRLRQLTPREANK